MRSADDRAFAYDSDGSGKIGTVWLFIGMGRSIFGIVGRNGGGDGGGVGSDFGAVYAQGDRGIGVGRYGLKSMADRALAFDHGGKRRLKGGRG